MEWSFVENGKLAWRQARAVGSSEFDRRGQGGPLHALPCYLIDFFYNFTTKCKEFIYVCLSIPSPLIDTVSWQYEFDPLDDPAVERRNWPLIQIPNIAKIKDKTLNAAMADINSLLSELHEVRYNPDPKNSAAQTVHIYIYTYIHIYNACI